MEISFKVGELAFIVNSSLFITSALLLIILSFQLVAHPNISLRDGLSAGAVIVLVAYASLLIHELSHAFVSILLGSKPIAIITTPFGMVTTFESTLKAMGSFGAIVVSGVGPLSHFIISGLAWATNKQIERVTLKKNRVLNLISRVNFDLGVFNLLPIFGLDGGQVVRYTALAITNDENTANLVLILISSGFCLAVFLLLVTKIFLGLYSKLTSKV